MNKYEKRKRKIIDKTFIFLSSFIVLVLFSIVSAVISLTLPDIVYLYGIVPMSLSYLVFGIFLMFWGFLTVLFIRLFKYKDRD